MTSEEQPEPAQQQEQGAGGRAVPRWFWMTAVIAVVIIAVDQLSKWWAEANLSNGEVIPVIGDLIRFRLVYNPGAAFSIGENFTWVFTIIAAIAAVAIAVFAWRVSSKRWAIALGLLLGGAVTHLGDRLFRQPGFARGHVVDFIDYVGFFIGNVADIAIFAGAVMILALSLFGVKLRPEAVDVDAAPESQKDA